MLTTVLTPGFQCNSANTTIDAAVKVTPIPAAVIDRTATITSSFS